MSAKDRILLILKNLVHPAGIAGILLSIAIPFLVYLGPNVSQKGLIKQLDLDLPLPLFCLQFVGIIVLFCLLSKDFRNWIQGILPPKQFTIITLGFTLAISIFAATQIEARHRVQSDESVFMSVAQNMYFNHQSGTCNQGLFSEAGLDCVAKSNSFKTKGLAFLYTLGMPLLGNDLHWIFYGELLLLPLTILLMFLAIVAWTRQPLLAFFAALLTALQPTVLFQFRSMSVEPLYIFLSALSLFTFKWAYDRNTVKHWTLCALILAFFAQTRQETVFCFLPFILFALPRILDKKDFKAPAFFLTLSIFSIPVLLTISYFQGFGFQGGEFEAHGHFLEDLSKNWEVMTKPLNKDGNLSNPFLTYFNYLFLLGLAYLIFRAIKDTRQGNKFYLWNLIFLALYHIQTYVILENVSGDFGIEINQRYSLVMLPSMAYVGALPIAHLIEYFGFDSKTKKQTSSLLILTLMFALIFTGWTFHYKSNFNDNIMYNRNHLTIEEHEIWDWLKEQPKKERLFIYGRPWHFVGYGVSSIHYDKARQMSQEKLQELMEKYNNEVYYIRGLDCWDSQTYHKKAVEHRIPTTCDVFEKEMDMDEVKNILITNNYWVQIKKFNGRKIYNPRNVIVVSDPVFGNDSNSTDSLLHIQANLNEQGDVAAEWNVKVFQENKLVVDSAYRFGSMELSFEKSSLQPGFNLITFLVQNTTSGKTLANITKTYFNPGNGVKKLSELTYASHRQDWGSFHYNASVDNNKLTINGTIFPEGFGTHAASETTFEIGKAYNSFRTTVGLDDESLCSEGVYVEIIGDGTVLAKSQNFRAGQIQTLTAHVEGVQQLTLKSTAVGSIDCSHVDFVNSVLIP